ncbi:MAG: UDP-N-acetylglucosamine 2-epimerase [Planctomycetota bacterium]|nr:UDP-N-acetylglucosamine 2-epimerase [Planctomycetota bacterium]
MSGGAERRVAVVTGSRAEFGLLEPALAALARRPGVRTSVIACGSHLVGDEPTVRDIEAAGFVVAARVPMQMAGRTGRLEDAVALGRGVEGLARVYAELAPDWVLVLGDRIEAFAAASAASVAGVGVAHVHGGDRAEGVADEAMRHAITKLAHLHLCATAQSAERVRRMGERAEDVLVVGSPAVDGLDEIAALDDRAAAELGDPAAVFLMHPSGTGSERDAADGRALLAALERSLCGRAVLCLEPNFDAGREAVLTMLSEEAGRRGWRVLAHLPRRTFVGLLKRLAARGGVLAGNSSAGLIEAAALRLPAVNIGGRQAGRERPDNTVDAGDAAAAPGAVERALMLERAGLTHPYGDGRSGERIAAALADRRPEVRKRCVF